MSLFEDIYKHDILKGCGKSDFNMDAQILKWEQFPGQLVKMILQTHVKSTGLLFSIDLCTMLL